MCLRVVLVCIDAGMSLRHNVTLPTMRLAAEDVIICKLAWEILKGKLPSGHNDIRRCDNVFCLLNMKVETTLGFVVTTMWFVMTMNLYIQQIKHLATASGFVATSWQCQLCCVCPLSNDEEATRNSNYFFKVNGFPLAAKFTCHSLVSGLGLSLRTWNP